MRTVSGDPSPGLAAPGDGLEKLKSMGETPSDRCGFDEDDNPSI
jgi:hypothetical protein